MESSPFEVVDGIIAERLTRRCPQHRPLVADLVRAAREGHICLETHLADKLPLDLCSEGVEPAPLCRWKDRLYLQKYYAWETLLLEELTRLTRGAAALCSAPPTSLPSSSLTEEQEKAILQALRVPLTLILGGPGTGKTFTAAKLVISACHHRADRSRPLRVLLLAPSAKAADRLRASVLRALEGDEELLLTSGTLHRHLRLTHDGERELPLLLADLILVDECSMIDLRVFSRLFSAVPAKSHLVLMGDPDQLPSVEVGSVWSDLAELSSAGQLLATRLTHCIRVESSDLLQCAQAIRCGDAEQALHSLQPIAVDWEAPLEGGYHRIWAHVRGAFPTGDPNLATLPSFPFRILSCLRRGAWGVEALNKMLLERFLLETPYGSWCSIPIMLTRHLPRWGLGNGEEGVLYWRRGREEENFFLFDRAGEAPLRLTAELLSDYQPAYALSVHKSQGSEFTDVLLLVPPGSEHFGREILYTAVTRARRKVIVEADLTLLRQALTQSVRRRSGIVERWYAL